MADATKQQNKTSSKEKNVIAASSIVPGYEVLR